MTYYIAVDTDMTNDNKLVKCDGFFVLIWEIYTMDYKESNWVNKYN